MSQEKSKGIDKKDREQNIIAKIKYCSYSKAEIKKIVSEGNPYHFGHANDMEYYPPAHHNPKLRNL